MPVFSSPLRFRQQSTAITPATGESAMWMDTNGTLRTKDPSGVEKALSGSVYDDTGWIIPTLQNGWVRLDNTWESAGYRRINGIVYLRGMIRAGTTTDGTTIFNLPVGFRPGISDGEGLNGKHMPVAIAGGTGVIKARQTGDVQTGTPVSATWTSLADVSFPADDYVPPTSFTRALDQTGVTNGAKTTATGTTAFLRGSEVIVNVNVTVNSAMVAGDLLFTLPVGYRPSTTIFVTLENANPEPPVAHRFHIMTDGGVQLQGSTSLPPSGALFRGSFTLPVALTVAQRGGLDTHSLKAGFNVNGGGTPKVSSAYEIAWTSRFIVISNGKGEHFAPDGYFNIDMPASGTVIAGVGGAASQTVNANGIPMPAWHALYYVLPIGAPATGLPGNFRIASYTQDLVVPENWLLIAIRNSDTNGPIKFCTGITMDPWIAPTLAGSWTNYGGGFAPAGFRRVNGVVYLQGLVQGGTGTIFTLPEGFRPSRGTLIFDTDSNSAHCRFDVRSDGVVFLNVGSNAHVSLSVASFPADQ